MSRSMRSEFLPQNRLRQYDDSGWFHDASRPLPEFVACCGCGERSRNPHGTGWRLGPGGWACPECAEPEPSADAGPLLAAVCAAAFFGLVLWVVLR
jgi:hypothetical protein